MVEYTRRKETDANDYGLWLTTVLLLSMAVMLTMFSSAYIRDLETLRTVPDALWDAMCGRPDPDGLTLPILMASATLCYLGAGGVYLWKRIRLVRLNQAQAE